MSEPGPEAEPDGFDGMAFHLQEESIDQVNAAVIRSLLLRELYGHGPTICVDVSSVHFIDSSGLGMLVGVLKEAREMNGDMRLVNPSREVRQVLRITGLDSLFLTE